MSQHKGKKKKKRKPNANNAPNDGREHEGQIEADAPSDEIPADEESNARTRAVAQSYISMRDSERKWKEESRHRNAVVAMRALVRQRKWTRALFLSTMEPIKVHRTLSSTLISNDARSDPPTYEVRGLFKDIIKRCQTEIKEKMLEVDDIVLILDPIFVIITALHDGHDMSFDTCVELSTVVDIFHFLHQHPAGSPSHALRGAFRILTHIFGYAGDHPRALVADCIRLKLPLPLADFMLSSDEYTASTSRQFADYIFDDTLPGPNGPTAEMDMLVISFLKIAARPDFGDGPVHGHLVLMLHDYCLLSGFRDVPVIHLGYFGQLIQSLTIYVEKYTELEDVGSFLLRGFATILLFIETARKLGPSVADLPGPDREATEMLLGRLAGLPCPRLLLGYTIDRVADIIGAPHLRTKPEMTMFADYAPVSDTVARFLGDTLVTTIRENSVSRHAVYSVEGIEGTLDEGAVRARAQWLVDRMVLATAKDLHRLPVLFSVLISTVHLDGLSYAALWESGALWSSLERVARDSNECARLRWPISHIFKFLAFVAQFPEGCQLIVRGTLVDLVRSMLWYMAQVTDAFGYPERASEVEAAAAPLKCAFDIEDAYELVPVEIRRVTEDAPFRVIFTTEAFTVMNFHAHLSTTEVAGLLLGTYDREYEEMTILAAIPCSTESWGTQSRIDPEIFTATRDATRDTNIAILGWYHSHPVYEPAPSHHDIETHLAHQATLGQEVPFLGVIVSPYARRSDHAAVTCWVTTSDDASRGHVPHRVWIESVRGETLVPTDLVEKLTSLMSKVHISPGRIDMNRTFHGSPGETTSNLEKTLRSLRACLRGVDETVTAIILGMMREILFKAEDALKEAGAACADSVCMLTPDPQRTWMRHPDNRAHEKMETKEHFDLLVDICMSLAHSDVRAPVFPLLGQHLKAIAAEIHTNDGRALYAAALLCPDATPDVIHLIEMGSILLEHGNTVEAGYLVLTWWHLFLREKRLGTSFEWELCEPAEAYDFLRAFAYPAEESGDPLIRDTARDAIALAVELYGLPATVSHTRCDD